MSVNIVDKSTGNLTKIAGNPIEQASGISYDHTSSGMQANNVQAAVDELKSGLTNLDNEVNGDATTYPYADVITIEDAVPANLANCSVKIEPVQDLHGYDKPWVGGAGKNKLITHDLATLKSLNTGGTWSDNKYTFHGVTYTVITDNDGNVTGININGTATDGLSDFYFTTTTRKTLDNYGLVVGNSYIFTNGLASDVSGAIIMFNGTATNIEASASGRTFIVNSTDMYSINIRVYNNITVNNILFKPMIRLSTETDATFAPYTNICPISGHTEVSVKRDGRNLFKTTMSDGTTGGITYTKNADGSVSVSGTRTSAAQKTIGEAHVTSSMGTITVSGLTESTNIVLNKIRLYDKNNNELFQRSTFGTIDNLADYPTLDRVTVEVKGNGDGSVASGKVTIKVELGETATAWEPYAGQTYTIALGDTIYGGTVDFDSGVMTVDRKYIEFDGGETESWTSPQDRPHSFCHTENLGIADAWSGTDIKMISNQFTQNGEVAYYGSNYRIGYNATNGLFFVGFPSIDNVADFKTYLSNNHLQVVGILATPFTVQLTPQQIQLLKGTNTLTASTGDISVTVNGVSGAIGAVQTAVNNISEQLPTAPTTDGAYVLTVTVADGTPTYSWESAT